MSDFPTTITSPTNPTSGDHLNSPDHALQHQSHNAEIVAVETKIGTGASTPTNNTLLRGNGTGTSTWAALTSAQLAASLTDETGSGVAVFGTAPTISAPVVSTGTFASPVLTTPAVVTSINDANGNEVIKTPATASAVNEFTMTNAATGGNPVLSATGNDAVISPNIRGKGLAGKVTIGAGAAAIFPYDYVVSGCVLSGDAYGSTLNFSMTSGVVVINGNPVTVASFSASAATASRDTYVDVLDNGDGTGLVVKTGGNVVTNNAASPALASNSIRLGIVVSGAGNIAAATSVNQGQETMVLPIASSVPYSVTDSLGNLICPRDPNRKILGYRQILSSFSGSATSVAQVTGLTCPVIIPTGRKIKITLFYRDALSTGGGSFVHHEIWDGTVGSGTRIGASQTFTAAVTQSQPVNVTLITTPLSSSKTYNAGYFVSANSMSLETGATEPGYILVELV